MVSREFAKRRSAVHPDQPATPDAILSQLRGVSVCFMPKNQTPIVTPNSVNTIVTLDAAATRGMRQNDHAKPTAGVPGRLAEAFGKTCRPEYFN